MATPNEKVAADKTPAKRASRRTKVEDRAPLAPEVVDPRKPRTHRLADAVTVDRSELVNPGDPQEVYTEEDPGYASFHPQERLVLGQADVEESSASVIGAPGDTPDTIPHPADQEDPK